MSEHHFVNDEKKIILIWIHFNHAKLYNLKLINERTRHDSHWPEASRKAIS